jgi:hypothetical protein
MLQQLFTQLLPLLAAGNPIAVEIWNRQVLASGEPNADKFLLSGENLQAVQQSFQAAQAQSAASPQSKAQLAGRTAFSKEMGKHAAKVANGHMPLPGGPKAPA